MKKKNNEVTPRDGQSKSRADQIAASNIAHETMMKYATHTSVQMA